MKNFLSIGDKVKMKDGRNLTIKSLEFATFIANEEIGYQKKRDIIKKYENMRTTKQLIEEYFPWEKDMPLDDKWNLESIIEIIQREAYNQGIDDASENAKIKPKHKLSPGFMDQYEVDKQSILKLLKS